MPTKTITGTAMLLAVALVAQSLRIFFPFIPNQVSMFLIGSIVSASLVLATWRYGVKNGLIIAWLTPFVAYMQGMLPMAPFIPIVAIGSTLYVWMVKYWQHRSRLGLVLCSSVIRAAALYTGFLLFFQSFQVPQKLMTAILFSIGWPQLITAILGIVIALLIESRMRS